MSHTSVSRLRPAISDDSRRVEGRDARATNFAAGRALSETVRTTLGPRGLDKMLVGSDGTVVVTNDGASILDRTDTDHPAARTIEEVAFQQERRVGDGTTTAVVLTGELLAEAQRLVDRGLHPTSVTAGYRRAARVALDELEECALELDPDDREGLLDVTETVITGKWNERATSFFAGLAVDAVRAVDRRGAVDFERITRKAVAGGSVYDSELIEGLLVDVGSSSTDVVSPETEVPRRFEGASIALVDDQLTVETVSGLGTVSLDSPEQLEAFRRYEDEVYETYVERIADAGADVVFCQKSIDEPVRHLLATEGILAVERTRQDELYKLGRATGARHVASVDELTLADVGRASGVELRPVGDRDLLVVTGGAEFGQVSLLLRGGPPHVAEETKRLIDDCFHVLKLAVEERRIVPGGGAIEVELARRLRDRARGVGEREQFAVEAFADALEVVPRTLAATAGLDPVDSLLELRTRHYEGERTAGLDLDAGGVADVTARGVFEPLAVKRLAVASAEEAANAVVRVDDVIAASPGGTTTGAGGEEDRDRGSGRLVESTDGYPWAVGHSMSHDHGHGH